MDKIRIIIISIIIIITFMIIIEFNQFYDKTKRENLIIKYQLNTHNNIKTLNALTDSEIKKLTFNLNTQKYKIRHKIENFNKTYKNNNNCINFINIESDYLAIKIDPKGGHIVYAALKNYNTHIDTPNNPLILLEKNTQRTYIANSGLLNIDDNRYNNPLFFSKYKNYQLSKEKNNIVVDLTYQNKKIFFIKRFIIDSHSYMINIEYIIHNKSNKTWQTAMYGQIKRDNSIDPSQEYNNIGMQPYLGFAVNNKNNRFKKIKFKELKKGDLTDSLNGGWLAMIQHYFLSAWIPDPKTKNTFNFHYTHNGYNIASFTTPIIQIPKNQNYTIKASFYVGPKDQYKLEKISKNLDLSVDYGFLWMIAQPLYALLYFINQGEIHIFMNSIKIFSGIQNWGFTIILLTITIKTLFYSLNKKAYISMAKMRDIAPIIQKIKKQHDNDQQKISQETLKVYKDLNINPFGGFLPILIQMPVFIALYWVLLESVELRHAPFIGYIKDLSAMDPYFIMPLIMGFSMWLQQKFNTPQNDLIQRKIMQFLPIIFTFFFLFIPSGLVLYWICNNFLTIIQQWSINKKMNLRKL